MNTHNQKLSILKECHNHKCIIVLFGTICGMYGACHILTKHVYLFFIKFLWLFCWVFCADYNTIGNFFEGITAKKSSFGFAITPYSSTISDCFVQGFIYSIHFAQMQKSIKNTFNSWRKLNLCDLFDCISYICAGYLILFTIFFEEISAKRVHNTCLWILPPLLLFCVYLWFWSNLFVPHLVLHHIDFFGYFACLHTSFKRFFERCAMAWSSFWHGSFFRSDYGRILWSHSELLGHTTLLHFLSNAHCQ